MGRPIRRLWEGWVRSEKDVIMVLFMTMISVMPPRMMISA